MVNLTSRFYEETNSKKTNHYIETGAYLGDGIKRVLYNYPNIHSIELSEKWYAHNVDQFKYNSNVKMYLGDSKKVLPELLATIQEPVTIFLDAHYSGSFTAFGDEETPLLAELEIMKQRPYDDIIIIDDCRLVGKSGECGVPNDPRYPTMNYDWSHITNDRIQSLMKPNYVLLTNYNRDYTDGEADQYILAKKNT